MDKGEINEEISLRTDGIFDINDSNFNNRKYTNK